VIWKVNAASGSASARSLTIRVDCTTWSSVELAGVSTMPKMTPWSSVGASSFGDWTNMSSERTEIAIQAV
jgi:hypothetical protein